MNIIIPMAGYGQRFVDSGFRLPKPLIPIADQAMYRYAVDCLPLEMASRLVFIIRNDQFTNDLTQDIINCYSQYAVYIIALDHVTRGQAETVLKAQNIIDLNQPTLIHNCDTMIAHDLPWQTMINKDYDGCIVSFYSNLDRWSYIRLNKAKKLVIDIQEKKVISNYASTGTYYFKDTWQLMNNIKKIIDQNLSVNHEYYLSTVYQIMLEKAMKIAPLHSPLSLCFGTPQDLVDSMNILLLNSQSSDKSA